MDRPGVGEHVQGEVYEVNIEMLELLDEIEDVPRYYKRKLEKVKIIREPCSKMKIGDVLECWCYKMDNFREDLLADKTFLKSYTSKEFPYSES